MLNGVGSEKGKTKNIKSNQQKNNFAPAAHFFVHFSAIVVATWNLLVTRFMEKMLYVLTKNFVACVPVRFFFLTAAHFHLAGD